MTIKTCGLREPDNILALAALPIDWMGFIFYEKSPRYVGERPELADFLTQARRQLRQQWVGVFVNALPDTVVQTVRDFGLDKVQLHGGESPVYCENLKNVLQAADLAHVDIIRAFRVSRAFDFGITAAYQPYCSHFIFDTQAETAYGGTGHKFDWAVLDFYAGTTPFLLSGGIGPDDGVAIKALSHPALAGLDLNSRFEVAPGVKSVEALAGFLENL